MRHWIWTTVWMMVLGQVAFGVSHEFVPIYEKALGHSLAGGNLMNDSIYSNPAASAFSSVYSIDGVFAPPKTFAVSVLDTKTSSIGGGLGYFRRSFTDVPEVLQGIRLAFAGRVSNVVSVGVTGKMLWGPGVLRNAEGGATSDRFNNVDAGVFYNMGMLQVGGVLHNTISENENMGQYRKYSAGGRINWQQAMFLSFAASGHVNDVDPDEYSVGVEYVSPYFFALKGGFRTKPYEANSFWSMGASFNSPRMGLHYAVEIPNQKTSETEHLLGASLLF